MEYKETLDLIHGISPNAIKPGLKRIRDLLALMDNPQDKLSYIHVAGTNGKGSTCTMLSYILEKAGYKVGLNISPFVLDFRERFQINNQMIEKDELVEITEYVMHHWHTLQQLGDPPSEFEVVTAIAFEYFYRNACDIVVLEVGMGGRQDATNVITTPLVSVITSISKDHTSYLGDTLIEIAGEKAGIIKKDGTTVLYPQQDTEVMAVIMEACAEQNNRLIIPMNAVVEKTNIYGTEATIEGMELYIPLAGAHQVWNTATVVATCQVLQEKGFVLAEEQIQKGIAATRFPSRLEVLGQRPMVLLDGAHNLSGAQALAAALQEDLDGRTIHGVMGIMEDKDVEGFVKTIAPLCQSITTTSLPEMPRFLSPNTLAEQAKPYCQEVATEEDAKQAFLQAKARCGPEDVLLVCGSFYLTSALRPLALLEA